MMAAACAAQGADVEVVASNDNDRALLEVPLDQPVIDDAVTYRYFKRTMRPYTMSRSLAKWLRKNVNAYDVVHTHALFTYTTSVAASICRKAGVPYIIRPLGTLSEYGMKQHALLKQISWALVEKRALENAAAVHFTSMAERDDALSLGVHWRSEVVPLAVATSEFSAARDKRWLKQRNAPIDKLTLLFLSRIHEKKRLDLVIRACARVANVQLIVAGSGESRYEQSMRALAEAEGVADRVIWAGQVSGDEKRAVLAAADVFVLPSYNENFGIAAVEAIASGLPCILTAGVAVHREIEAADAGLISGGSVEAVVECIKGMNEPSARASMSRNARTLAENEFSIASMATGLMSMYRRAVA
jgi:glycosyltransferase involved in cell wall biosynthesis